MLLREFGPAWLPLSLFWLLPGCGALSSEDRTSFWFLLFIVMADLAYALSYEIAEDKDAYYLPTFISVAIAAGFGIRWLIQLSVSKAMAVTENVLDCCHGRCPHICDSVRGNWPFNNRRHYFIAHDYVENLSQHDRAKRAVTYIKIGRSPPRCFMNRRWNDAGPTSKLSISICCVARGTSIISNALILV